MEEGEGAAADFSGPGTRFRRAAPERLGGSLHRGDAAESSIETLRRVVAGRCGLR